MDELMEMTPLLDEHATPPVPRSYGPMEAVLDWREAAHLARRLGIDSEMGAKLRMLDPQFAAELVLHVPQAFLGGWRRARRA